jgi:hypothetical protein
MYRFSVSRRCDEWSGRASVKRRVHAEEVEDDSCIAGGGIE